MNVWRVRFLGVPGALCHDKLAHLRSKESWAVLASLIVPSVLRGEPYPAISRETLADRFWSDSHAIEPRTHLRQCLASLRQAFGAECLAADRHDVQILPGWFTTDLEQALSAYRQALNAASVEERLGRLMEAEAEIRGEFFEGWTPDSDEAQTWLIQLRADVRSRTVPVLLLLAETLETVGNLNAAFDVVRRVLRFQPGHPEARRFAWQLAASTGQQDVMHALDQTESFREALLKFPPAGMQTGTLHDQKLFQSLFLSELQRLPARLRQRFLHLAVLPAPFPAELARAVCQVSCTALRALAATPLVVAQERLFSLPAVVRECAWKQVPTATRRLLQRRLAECCIEWLPEMHSRPDDCPPLFASLEQAMPFLKLTADWVLAQEPTPEFPAFLNLLRHYGLVAPLEPVAVYLSLARQDETLSPEARMYAASCAAYAFMEIDQHAQAVAELEAGLPLAASTSADDMLVSLHSTLMMACHYAGDSDAAVAYGGLVLTHHREQSNFSYVASCLRFLGEIHNHLERFEQALAYCEEAVDLRRTGGTDSAGMADALYWKAKSLFRLQRYQEASDTIEETLSLWQEVGDVTGVGFCLRLIGQIRCVEGRYAEARTHLEHAVALHERTGSAVNRIAAVEALGDVLRAAQRYEEAQTHYEECLAFFTEKQHIVNVDRLKSQLEACSALPPGRE